MKVKNYSETAFAELQNSLMKHVDGGNSVEVLFKIISENDVKFPGLKNRFIHDMGSFLTHWFDLVQDSCRCSKKLRAKILTAKMIQEYSDFNSFVVFCYDNIDDTISSYTGKPLVSDIISYLACVTKAVIQTTRRSIGLDLNSSKYGNKSKTIKTATLTDQE